MDKIEKVNLENGWKKVCDTKEPTWKNCGIPSKTSCVDCKQGECPIPAVLRQVESVEEAYDLGYSEGLDMGYCDGYEDGIRHIPPTVADDDLEALYEDFSEGGENDYCPDFYADGSYLHKIERGKQLLHKIRMNLTDLRKGEDIDLRTISLDMLTVISLLSQVQEQYVIDEMYRYLGYFD